MLINFLRKAQVFGLSGGSKTFKSWTIAEMALAISQGAKFLQWEAIQSKVYYVDTELEDCDFQKRINLIARAKNIQIDGGEIELLSLRGIISNIDTLVEKL